MDVTERWKSRATGRAGRLAIATGAFGGDDVKRQSDGETTIGYRGEASGAVDSRERRAYTLPSPSSLLAMKIKPYSVTLVASR